MFFFPLEIDVKKPFLPLGNWAFVFFSPILGRMNF